MESWKDKLILSGKKEINLVREIN